MKDSVHFNRAVRFAFVCLLVVSSQLAVAQSKSASLAGVVKDTSGAVIPGASVTARNVATGQTRQTQSDDRGRYAFPNLDIGRHEITATSAGFQPTRLVAELSVGQQAEVDITLYLVGVTERVEVTAGQLAVETRSSTYGQLVTPAQIESLPLNGRDFSQLILLQLGAVQARSDQGDILTGKGAKISVHGARPTQNSYMLDGTDILDALGRNAASAQGLVSGIESVQEFAVLTNTYSAEYGRAAGGVFNIVTRSGTNEFHGSVFEFLRNSALDARNFFEHAPGVKKLPFTRNQFGFSAGGPIVKNKAFFFGAYEGFRERLGIADRQSVPSLAARRGAFLPEGKTINPAVLPYLALIPEPTIDNPTGEKATFIGQFKQISNLIVIRTTQNSTTISRSGTCSSSATRRMIRTSSSSIPRLSRTSRIAVKTTRSFSPSAKPEFFLAMSSIASGTRSTAPRQLKRRRLKMVSRNWPLSRARSSVTSSSAVSSDLARIAIRREASSKTPINSPTMSQSFEARI